MRIGLNRLSRLEPPEPPNRYERRRPGELIHIDIKKLGRFHRPGHRVRGRDAEGVWAGPPAGWECVHVAIDDYSRVAYVEILPDERGVTCAEFLEHAIAWFNDRAVRVERVMTDNGAGYIAKTFAAACARHNVRHLRTRPYRPRTNGKAERFIQTLLRDWAYAVRYETSHHRSLALPPWLDYYNQRRPHGALSHRAPITRLPAA